MTLKLVEGPAGGVGAGGWPTASTGPAGGKGDGLEAGGSLKARVKLPAVEAESEIPGVENPLCRAVLTKAGSGDGRVTGGGSGAWGTLLRSGFALDPLTKIRVNSP